MNNSTVFDCSVVDISKITSKVGNITVVENGKNIPFDIKRIYYLYDIPGGESRGGHAHYELEQYIIAASGAFDVILDDGINKTRFHLNRSYYGLYVPALIWRELDNFSSGAICLVLASHRYDENDYIRMYDAFLKEKLSIK